jgi:glycosyltransferase involved in cell wall biosynthesis
MAQIALMNDHTIRLGICAAGEAYGGVERFVDTFAEYLRDNTDIEFTVILFYENELAKRLRAAGIDIVTIIPRWKYDPRTIRRLAKLFREQNLSVIHTHGYLATILGTIAGKLCRAKVIKTEHGKMEPRSRRDLQWLRMCANRCVDELITGLFVDHVVYVTDDLRKAYHRKSRTTQQTVIHNGLVPRPVDTGNESVQTDPATFNVGIVGRLSTVKGHMNLLRALLVLQHPERVSVYVFGAGPLEGPLRDFCDEHNLSDRVHFMGFRQDVLDWVAQLNAFVIPSMHEGLPYALLEAMYLGVPVVASRVGGLAEVLDDGVDSILVEPGNERQLAAAIDRLVAEPALCNSLSANAHKKVKERFTIDRTVSEYLSVYDAVNRDQLRP